MDLFERIMDAHRGIRPAVPVSSLERSEGLSERLGCTVLLKNEHLQPTGSFKIRGATNRVRLLDPAEASRGVFTASTGNHGRAVARAGRLTGIAVTVFVAIETDAVKCAAIEAEGAVLKKVSGGALGAELTARAEAEAAGVPYLPPYNNYDVMAGQGTCGVELAEQAPDLDAVFVCVGGGGLIGGIGTAIHRLRPDAQVVGVWPAASTNMRDSLLAGKIVETPETPTLSDGSTGAIEPGSVTFPVCQEVIDRLITVDEDEIARAMRNLAITEHWIVEGSAAVPLAGLVQTAEEWRGKTIALVICGRNVALETFLGAVERTAVPAL